MGRSFKLLLLLVFAIGIGVGISMAMEQKQRFAAMTEEEQRSFLADKIGDKVSPEKLAEIQDAVVSKMSGMRA
jgi:hypothetical protein